MKKIWNRRTKVILWLVFALSFLALTCILGSLNGEAARTSDFSRKNLAPCFPYLFGTDWMGRDMLARTLRGMSLSILLGVVSAAISALIAFILGVIAAVGGKWADAIVTFLIDLVMGIPHILLLLLISVALGKGLRGVVAGVALTHWTSLSRLIRSEILQLKESNYIKIAEKLGKSRWYLVRKHMIPQILPQFIVGTVLIFPHAILHESSITFLGFGLSSEQPAIGVILSEAMQHLITGKWWLAVFPGLYLVLTVVLFYITGESLRKLIDPASVHE